MFITKPLSTLVLLLGLLFKVFIGYDWRSKEWQPTSNFLQIKDSEMCLCWYYYNHGFNQGIVD
jgi:hypothetical protein